MKPTQEEAAGRAAVWLAAAGLFVHTLDPSIVIVALPAMAAALGADPLAMHSVVLAYVLTVALITPVSGRLADRFGVREVYGGGLVLFCAGAALCALAPNRSSTSVRRTSERSSCCSGIRSWKAPSGISALKSMTHSRSQSRPISRLLSAWRLSFHRKKPGSACPTRRQAAAA